MESGRKGRETISSGPMPLGGDSGEKGHYADRDPPWGLSGSSHWSPGAPHREYRPFWLIGGPLPVRRTCMLACT